MQFDVHFCFDVFFRTMSASIRFLRLSANQDQGVSPRPGRGVYDDEDLRTPRFAHHFVSYQCQLGSGTKYHPMENVAGRVCIHTSTRGFTILIKTLGAGESYAFDNVFTVAVQSTAVDTATIKITLPVRPKEENFNLVQRIRMHTAGGRKVA